MDYSVYRRRVDSLASSLVEEDLRACILVGESNIYYYTGSRGASAALVHSEGDVEILTTRLEYNRVLDERVLGEIYVYAEHDSEYVPPDSLVRGSLQDAIGELLKTRGVDFRRLGANLDEMRYNFAKSLFEKLGGEPKNISKIVADARAIKSREEIGAIRRAIAIAQNSMAKAVESLREGVTEMEIVNVIESEFRKRGALNAFTTIVAFGEHSAHPHAVPSTRKLAKGDIVKIDLGAKIFGYCSDITRTVVFGSATTRQQEMLRSVIRAQEDAIETIKPGVPAADVDASARKALASAKLLKFFTHSTGHGVGIDVHEKPLLGPGSKDTLREGMVVTVEPGVYMHGFGGVRVEDMVLVVEDGYELLTSIEKEL